MFIVMSVLMTLYETWFAEKIKHAKRELYNWDVFLNEIYYDGVY